MSHREITLHVIFHVVVVVRGVSCVKVVARGVVEESVVSGVVGELVVSIRCPWGGEDLVVEWGKSLRRTRLKRRLRSMRSFTRG